MKRMSTRMITPAKRSPAARKLHAPGRLFVSLLLFAMTLGSFPSFTWVAEAADDPIPAEMGGWVVVGTAEELDYMKRHEDVYLDRQIRLIRDIDMSGYEWLPFGSDAAPFSGVFDGRGHRITGVSMAADSLSSVGFFGSVTGMIQHLGVSGQVSGGNYTGILAGRLNGGSIMASFSHGEVTGGSHAVVSVTGGLVGEAIGDSHIIRSYSTAVVKGGNAPNQYAGGLVGAQGAGFITDSYATGAVSYSETNNFVFVGGLTGQLIFGTIANSYSSGAVAPAGSAYYNAIGGFVGIAAAQNATITASYFDLLATGQINGVGSENHYPQLTGLATHEMKDENHFEASWDFSGTWAAHFGVNEGYPYLRPDVLTDELPRALKDAPYLFALEAWDGAGEGLIWSATGLPPGLALQNGGMLEGAPLQGGLYPIEISVMDAGFKQASANLILHVDEPAPDIAGFFISPGHVVGSTSAAADAGSQGHAFAYVLAGDAGQRPLLGDLLPDEATSYLPNTDIVGVSPQQILQLYEVDDEGRIHAWSIIELAASYIRHQVHVKGVKLDAEELTLVKNGPAGKLNAAVVPEDATNRTVIWSSNHPQIAEVNASGEVTPLSEGLAVITATTEDGAYTASATVNVQAAPPLTGGITGVVYGTGNRPVSRAAVSLGLVNGWTDDEGRFELADLATGSYALTVTESGYHPYSMTVNVVAGETVHLDKIELKAVPSPGSAPVWNDTRPFNVDTGTLSVIINGHAARVPVVNEREDGQAVLRLVMNEELIQSQLAVPGGADIQINTEAPVVKVDFPAEALSVLYPLQPDAVIRICVNGACSSLPLQMLKDVPTNATVTAAIAKMPHSAREELKAAMALQGFTILAEPVSFNFFSNGKERIRPNGVYTEHILPITAALQPDRSAAVRVDQAWQPHFVPSVFEPETATLYTAASGWFTVLQSDRTFTDIQGHWAQNDIELMARKFIVNGADDLTFEPDRDITRAEFVAMLIRTMGLAEKHQQLSFSDVSWQENRYAGAIHAASAAGLVEGYADGTFKPNQVVTREQMTVMLDRAIQYTGELPSVDKTRLELFGDHAEVSNWAKGATERLLSSDLIEGVEHAVLAPQRHATRAQSVVFLARMLRYLNFINS